MVRFLVIIKKRPYSACLNRTDGNPIPCVWHISEGTHTIEVRAFVIENGRKIELPGLTLTFTLIQSRQVDGVLQLTVVNGNTGSYVRELSDGATLDVVEFEQGLFNIGSKIAPVENIGSVAFFVDGSRYNIDSDAPFTLCQESCFFDFDSNHTIQAIAYTEKNMRGRKYPPMEITFFLKKSFQVDGVMQLVLVDTVTGEVITDLHNNSVVDRARFTYGEFSIKAITIPEILGSVTFFLNGKYLNRDNEPPIRFLWTVKQHHVPLPLEN